MAKKEQNRSFKRIFPILGFTLLGLAAWWGWHSPAFSNAKDQLFQYVENGNITTLETRFSPQQIVDAHKSELLGKEKKTLQNSTLKYYPYLLLDVKYPDQSKTKEAVLLWGLNDGEMVLSTETWETSHGFKDCLECKATRSDFKILQALAKKGGSATAEELQKELQVERDLLSQWIESAKKKYLIMQKGHLLQLHFENPKLLVSPQTKVKQQFVSKPIGEGQKMARSYSHAQILEMSTAAFGSDFNIRSKTEIFLPVYSLEILNPDGSTQTSDWNAVTGQRIAPNYLLKS